MKEYSYSLELPHSKKRVWTIMQDYDKWPEFAKPMVIDVVIDNPGDEQGNGLVRRLKYKMPLGIKGESVETVHNVISGTGYTYTTEKGTVGTLRLEELEPNKTRLHFTEKMKLNWPFSWFEGLIHKFIKNNNKKTMLNMSQWLIDHPEYHPELIHEDTTK